MKLITIWNGGSFDKTIDIQVVSGVNERRTFTLKIFCHQVQSKEDEMIYNELINQLVSGFALIEGMKIKQCLEEIIVEHRGKDNVV